MMGYGTNGTEQRNNGCFIGGAIGTELFPVGEVPFRSYGLPKIYDLRNQFRRLAGKGMTNPPPGD
jgi:hypothetical protein